MARWPLFVTLLAASSPSVPGSSASPPPPGSASPPPSSRSSAESPDDEALPLGSVELRASEALIPMESWGGRPVVVVTINGKGPYRFVLDTGASGGVLTQALAKQLDLPTIREIEVMSPGSPAPLKGAVVSLDEIGFGSGSIRGAAITVMDLGAVFSSENAPVGVLSAAGFPGHLVTFDYPRSVVKIRAGSLPPPDGRMTFAYESPDGLPPLPTVPVRLGDLEFLAHLDTGAPQALLLPREFIERVKLKDAPVEVESGATVDQRFRVQAGVAVDAIRIGEYGWESALIHFGGLPQPNIGGKILSEFEITLDADNRRVRLERPRR